MSFDATLTRDHVLSNCILGTLIAKGDVFYTLELPWKNNEHNISCIPVGAYSCELTTRCDKPGGIKVYMLCDVPKRISILMHPGNYPKDTHGCILIGMGRSIEKQMVINSVQAVDLFIKIMGPTFVLNIIGNTHFQGEAV
jgi:hypothetical protein